MGDSGRGQGASLGQLLALLGGYLLRYRGLVAGILTLGVLQAAITKAPYLLIKDVVDVFSPPSSGGSGSLPLYEALESFKDSLLGALGLEALQGSRGVGNRLAGSSLLLAVLAVLGGVVIYFYRYLSNLAATRVVVDMRNRLCSHLLFLPSGYFGKQRTGDLISRVSNDTNTIRHSFTLVFENAVLEPLFLLVNMAIAFSVNAAMGWFVVSMVPILGFPMARFGRKVRKGSGKSLEALSEATDAMAQMFVGYRTVKSYRLEEQELEEFERVNLRFLRRTMRMVRAKGASQGLLYLTYMLGFAGMLYGLQFLPRGDLAALGIGLAAVGTSYTHIKRAARTFNLLKESQGALDRIQELMTLPKTKSAGEGGVRLEHPEGRVVFENVTFAYEEEAVLSDLSFAVAPGEKVAFVGPSGAGKSTILNLLARFHSPNEGRILFDGIPLEEIDLDSYLRHVALVDQSPFLFHRSIRENILLGRPEASGEEVRAAAEAARVMEFAERLPEGLDTIVGEAGSLLSGGQRQRVTIARAMLRNPVLLLLDEATSALDTESERLVQEALDRLMEGKTSIVIAHRLSTVRSADRIFVLEGGRIREAGNHEDLMRKENGLYRHLHSLQS